MTNHVDKLPEIYSDGYYSNMFIILMFICLILTIICNQIHVPHEVATIFLGIASGLFVSSIPGLVLLNTDLIIPPNIMVILHPIIIMKLVYNLDTYLFSKSLSQIILISTFGLWAYIFIFGFLLIMLSPTGPTLLTFINIVSAGIILAPIEVPDAILELERIKHLETLMNGECVFGTAICFMTFFLCLGGYDGYINTWYHVLFYYLRYIVISVIFGFLFGKICAFVFRKSYNDALNASALLVGSSHFVYFVAEILLFTSGPIAAFTNIYCISQERSRLSPDVDNSIQNYINIMYYTSSMVFVIFLTTNIVSRIYTFFTVLQVAVSLGAYVAGNVARLIILLMLSPILSRVGYGFNFTSMIALFWAPKKGSMQMLHIAAFHYYDVTNYMGINFVCFSMMYLLLLSLVNSTTIKTILKLFGLLEFSIVRKNNITNCFGIINEKRLRLIAIMKMNRSFSDANWPLIQETTVLKNAYSKEGLDDTDSDENMWTMRKMTCPECSRNIYIEPSKKDLLDLSREVRLRVLKGQRVSFVKQYESGLLTKPALRGLLQAVEIAMDSQDLIIKLDDLIKMFSDKRFIEKLKIYLMQFKVDDSYMVPRNKCKRHCYKIGSHRAFHLSSYFVVSINVLVLMVQCIFANFFQNIRYVIYISNFLFFSFYLAEFIIIVVGYSNNGFKSGFKIYIRSHWNKFDFIMLLIYMTHTFTAPPLEMFETDNSDTYLQTLLFLKFFRTIKLFKIFEHFFPRLVTYCDTKIDIRVTYAFTIGKALVIAYEDVSENLTKVSENEKIRESIRLKIDSDKMAISRELGMLSKDRPWIAITLKTKQAMSATFIHMRNTIFELKYAGIVDNYEFDKLNQTINDALKDVAGLKALNCMTPKHIFYEVPWIYEETSIMDFLFNNVATKIWDAGDIICKHGEKAEGIFILVAGLFQMSYIPIDEYLRDLSEYGLLPVKDYIRHCRFKDAEDEYLMMGSSIGEFSVLTGRPYSSNIIAAAPSQAFIIPSKIIKQVVEEMNTNPVNGLACRLWKYISFTVAKRIMQDTVTFDSFSDSKLNDILARAFVPNLKNYKMLVLMEFIEDAILIEGLLVDYNTREIYTAPCYIPRNVQKMLLPQTTSDFLTMKVETQIMLVPVRGADEFDAMEKIQALSEMIAKPNPRYVLTESMLKNRQHRKTLKMSKTRTQNKPSVAVSDNIATIYEKFSGTSMQRMSDIVKDDGKKEFK